MNYVKKISNTVTLADQPTEEDLAKLKAEGFAAVVNLRMDGEPDQPMSVSEEGEKIRALGMEYLHVPVVGAPLTDEGVSAFCSFMDRHEADKVLVHCRRGARAAAMVLIHEAKKQGWGSGEALVKGPMTGLVVDGPLATLVRNYLDGSF